MGSPSSKSRIGLGWTGVIGVAVSIVLLWWTLHDITVSEVVGHIRQVRIVPFIGCIVTATLVFPLRTLRWRYLLRLDGTALPFTPMWHALAIGFMANNLIPARAGELARSLAVHRLTGVRFTTAAASIAVERVMDGLTLLTLLIIAMFAGGFDASTAVGSVTLGQVVTLTAGVFLGLLAGAAFAVYQPRMAIAVCRRVSEVLLPARWSEKVVHVVEGLLAGLDTLRDAKRFAAVAVWSFIVWGVNGLSFWLCMVAFNLDVPGSAALTLQSLIAFGVAVPSAPGFFGPFEAVTRATLPLYDVSVDVAVSYAFGYHLFTFLPITLLGLWSLSRARLHLTDLGQSARES